jgi:rare lipoprotein A
MDRPRLPLLILTCARLAAAGGLPAGCAERTSAEPAPTAADIGDERSAQRRRAAAGPSQRGEASYYGPQFAGRTTASGERFDPDSNMAAHRTLPFGTRARVTNLENGRSATVRVEDRGPFVGGRIIDVSPRTAERLGMREAGTAEVRVTPVAPPPGDNRR